jgi:chromosome segregation ATPase
MSSLIKEARMSDQKRPTPAEFQTYVNESIKKLTDDPDSLEKNERRLLGKLKKSSDAAQQSVKDVQALRNQITQAEARLRSLQLQIENYQGAANAYADELMSLKFDVELTDEEGCS